MVRVCVRHVGVFLPAIEIVCYDFLLSHKFIFSALSGVSVHFHYVIMFIFMDFLGSIKIYSFHLV